MTSAAGSAVRVGLDPVLVLPSGRVDALVEVALPVHEPDPDHGQRLVGGLLQDVAGQHAEPARVDRAATRGRRTRRTGTPPAGPPADRRTAGPGRPARSIEGLGAPTSTRVLGAARSTGSGGGLQEQPHRVPRRTRPSDTGRAPRRLGAAGRPRPAVVVGEPGQGDERLGEALGELGGGRFEVVVTGDYPPAKCRAFARSRRQLQRRASDPRIRRARVDRAAPYDQVHEHPEVRQHEHEQHPQRLRPTGIVTAEDDRSEHDEQQPQPDDPEREPQERPNT